MSSMSLISRTRRRLLLWTRVISFCAGSGRRSCMFVFSIPGDTSTEVSGVRSSWLMVVMKASFICWEAFSSEISQATPT